MFSERCSFLLRWIRLRPLLVVLLASAVGCGVRTGDVSGEVKYEGTPLPEGKITFLCEGGDKPTPFARIREGKYELKGVPAGPVKITVATYPPTVAVSPPPGMGAMKPPGREKPPAGSGAYVEIPRRYSQFDQSNLDYTVQPGSQVHNINLDP